MFNQIFKENVQGRKHPGGYAFAEPDDIEMWKGGVFLIITNQITIFVVIRWYAIVFECYILGDWHFILHNPSVVIATTPIEFIIFTTITFDMVNRSI